MDYFFQKLEIPAIDVGAGDRLVETLSKSETMGGIKVLQSDKSLGPDWFPVELYVVFSDLLSLLLVNMSNI